MTGSEGKSDFCFPNETLTVLGLIKALKCRDFRELARPDHVRVKSSSCCFTWELVSFDPWQVTRFPPIGKRIWVGRSVTINLAENPENLFQWELVCYQRLLTQCQLSTEIVGKSQEPAIAWVHQLCPLCSKCRILVFKGLHWSTLFCYGLSIIELFCLFKS